MTISFDGTGDTLIVDPSLGSQVKPIAVLILRPAEWTHVVVVSDGPSVRVYINGTESRPIEGP